MRKWQAWLAGHKHAFEFFDGCPTRVYHPKDKSVVERCVQIVENDLMQPLAKLDIHSVAEYNELLWNKLDKRIADDS